MWESQALPENENRRAIMYYNGGCWCFSPDKSFELELAKAGLLCCAHAICRRKWWDPSDDDGGSREIEARRSSSDFGFLGRSDFEESSNLVLTRAVNARSLVLRIRGPWEFGGSAAEGESTTLTLHLNVRGFVEKSFHPQINRNGSQRTCCAGEPCDCPFQEFVDLALHQVHEALRVPVGKQLGRDVQHTLWALLASGSDAVQKARRHISRVAKEQAAGGNVIAAVQAEDDSSNPSQDDSDTPPATVSPKEAPALAAWLQELLGLGGCGLELDEWLQKEEDPDRRAAAEAIRQLAERLATNAAWSQLLPPPGTFFHPSGGEWSQPPPGIDAAQIQMIADRAWRFGFGEAGTTTAGGEEEEADWTVFLDTDRERTRTLAWLGDAVLLLLLAAEGSKKLLRPSQLQRLAACLLSNENLSDGEPSPAKQHSRATKKEAAVGEAFAAWLQAEPDAVTRLEKALQDIRISAPDTDLQKPAPVCLAIRTAVRCCSEKRDAKQKEDARVSASPEVAGRNKSNRRRSKVKGR